MQLVQELQKVVIQALVQKAVLIQALVQKAVLIQTLHLLHLQIHNPHQEQA